MRAKQCNEDCFNCPYPDCIVEQTQKEWFRNYHYERQTRLKANGMCICCGKVPATPGLAMCDKCREKHNASNRRTLKKHMEKGLCIKCGQRKEDPKKTLCLECGRRDRKRKKIYLEGRREEWIKQGLCSMCGKNPARPGLKTCVSCGEKRKTNYRKRRMRNGANNRTGTDAKKL